MGIKNLLFFSFLLVFCFSKATGSVNYDIVVSQNGDGDFKTVQEAFNSIPDNSNNETTIFIKNGIYKEKVVLPASKKLVSVTGESAEKTIITWDDYSGKDTITTGTSWTFKVEGNDISIENLTIENSEGLRGQAVALRVEGDRCMFRNCRIIGNQDTLYANGENSHQYYKNCHIEGTTDFIFGSATAVFQDCDILCKKHSYITAASTQQSSEFGYVFLNCKIEPAPGITRVYMERPWRAYANVVFIHCDLGEHIVPEGWHKWHETERYKTAFYAEYNNYGPGADTTQRVSWSHQLAAEQAKKYNVENILHLSKWKIK